MHGEDQTATQTVLSPQKTYKRIYLAIAPMPLTWGAGEAQVKRGRVNLALSVLLRTGPRRAVGFAGRA